MKKIYLVLFVILSVFVFSCKDNLISDDLISDDLSSSQNSGVGQVKVFVKQSRLFGPDVSDVDWTVELYKGNAKFSGKNKNGYYLFSGLSDGTYNVKVSGKTGDIEKFTGSAQVTIANGNSVSVNVPIVAKKTDKENGDTEEKTGYATITMDMSDELLSLLNSMDEDAYFEAYLSTDLNEYGNVTASLVKITYDDQRNPFIEFLDNQKVEFVGNIPSPNVTTENPIPTGYYYLTFSDLGSFTIKLKDNLVEIGDGLTTNIVLTQNDYELVEVLTESQIFYVDNSDNQSDDSSTFGTSLSKPLGFRNINDNTSDGNILYLISDVNTYVDDQNRISYISGKTITSFGTDIFNIINNNEKFSLKFERTFLKNIKLTNTTGNGFSLLQCPVDGTVILDTPIVQDSNTDSTVLMSKSSNLEIGQNFSGELGIRLSPENWQLGDTVVTFENGKPNNANFYISESYDSQGNSLASKFYIDDNGKLAQYDASTQWVNFAWNDECPYLITQTQAKNKTYTSIYDSNWYLLNGFNGISTYDEENQTWYFIANGSNASVNTVPSLYKVSAPTEYTDIVSPEKLCEVKLDEAGQTQINVQDIYIYDDKIYLCNLSNGTYEVYVSNLNGIDFDWNFLHSTLDTVTALLVENDVIYIATTTSVDNFGVTHSEIWRYKWDSDLGYTSVVDTYNQDEKIITVPYYQTSSDEELTVGESFPENSTFRITDLYIDGTEVYGLLANYGSVAEGSSYTLAEKIHLRGSIFKLGVNSDDAIGAPKMTATHSYLRDTLVVSGDYKQDFILPRKIVGIYNRKLFIADDGLIPDGSRNLNRFSVFDLDTAVSEFIEVSFDFSVSSASSAPFTVYGSIYENNFN